MQRDRIWELDAFRGICILCVIVIHFVFDLSYFLGIRLGLPRVYYFIQENGGVLFILLSGICATLGSRSFRRGLIVFLCGMLIMYLFDRATGTNYWFMTGPGNDSPLMSFYEKGGYNAYLTAFIAAGCLVTALWYGLRCLILLRHRK